MTWVVRRAQNAAFCRSIEHYSKEDNAENEKHVTTTNPPPKKKKTNDECNSFSFVVVFGWLAGLFKILCDDSFEVRRNCEQVLDAFLAKITKANNSLDYPIDYPAMMEVLIAFCGPSKHLISRFMVSVLG